MKITTATLILALTAIAGAQAPTTPPPKPKVLKPAPSATPKSKPKPRTKPKPKPAPEPSSDPANLADLPPAEQPQNPASGQPAPAPAPAPAIAPAAAPAAEAPKRSRVAEAAFSGYMPKVKASLGKGWSAAIQPRATEFTPGDVSLLFTLDASGVVTDARITGNSSNEAFAKFCETYVRAIQFDTPPARALENGALQIPFTFSLY